MINLETVKRWARELKAQLLTLWFCRSHSQPGPWCTSPHGSIGVSALF